MSPAPKNKSVLVACSLVRYARHTQTVNLYADRDRHFCTAHFAPRTPLFVRLCAVFRVRPSSPKISRAAQSRRRWIEPPGHTPTAPADDCGRSAASSVSSAWRARRSPIDWRWANADQRLPHAAPFHCWSLRNIITKMLAHRHNAACGGAASCIHSHHSSRIPPSQEPRPTHTQICERNKCFLFGGSTRPASPWLGSCGLLAALD